MDEKLYYCSILKHMLYPCYKLGGGLFNFSMPQIIFQPHSATNYAIYQFHIILQNIHMHHIWETSYHLHVFYCILAKIVIWVQIPLSLYALKLIMINANDLQCSWTWPKKLLLTYVVMFSLINYYIQMNCLSEVLDLVYFF